MNLNGPECLIPQGESRGFMNRYNDYNGENNLPGISRLTPELTSVDEFGRPLSAGILELAHINVDSDPRQRLQQQKQQVQQQQIMQQQPHLHLNKREKEQQMREEVHYQWMEKHSAANKEMAWNQWAKNIGAAKLKWEKLSEAELMTSEGQAAKLIELVRDRYTMSRDEADREVKGFFQKCIR
jgi:uncharacterized protein YjbJ (UPF0337 family)